MTIFLLCEGVPNLINLIHPLKVYSKALRRTVRLVVWYPDGRMNGWQLYFSTNEEDAGIDVLDM